MSQRHPHPPACRSFSSHPRLILLSLGVMLPACGNSSSTSHGLESAGGSAGLGMSGPQAGEAGGAAAPSLGGANNAATGGSTAGAVGGTPQSSAGGLGGTGADTGGALSGAGTFGAAGGAPSGVAGGASPSGGASDGGTANGGGSAGGAAAFDRVAVSAIMRRVADYDLALFGSGNDDGWVRAVFQMGALAAYRALGDAKYHAYTLQWAQANRFQLHADANGLRFADNQACVQSYAELYLADPGAQNATYLAAAQTTFDAMVAAPMAGRKEWWWCDALFMAPGALLRVAQATGKTQYVTLVNTMFWDTEAFLYDPAQSLFWRDGTFVNTNTYWARGNGWVVAGIARILEVLPPSDPRRADYEALLNQMASKLKSIQADDGFWRSSLTQPNAFPTPESSGTALFTYGIAWGIGHGVLEREAYLPTVSKAWSALGSAVNAQGRLGWVQGVGSAPGPSTVDSTNDYASGAFLLAGSEILKL